jgi:stage II sporulation protein D
VSDPYDSAGGQNPYYRWSYDLSLQAAAAKLRGLVRGSFIGIRVLQHGASPRIILASVVGSAGTVNVAGYQLEGAFGLMSTWASFTTITTLPGRGTVHQTRRHGSRARPRSGGGTSPGSPSGGSGLGSAAAASGASSGGAGIVSYLQTIRALSRQAPGLHGLIFPAQSGELVQVQQRLGASWSTVTQVRLDSHGGYSLSLSSHGTYRVVYRGLDGPAVGV